MSQSLPKAPSYFYRTNSRGLIEAVDALTGKILSVQSSPYDFMSEKMENLVRLELPDGPVYLEKGMSFDLVGKKYTSDYSNAIADLICEKVANGATLHSAGEDFKINYSTICRWRREIPHFREALEKASQDRAEHFHDKAIEAAEKSYDVKLHIDTLKWAAEKGDSEKYGAKTKISGDKNAPLTFVIDTGIRRPGDAGFAHVEEPVIDVEQPKEIVVKVDPYAVD